MIRRWIKNGVPHSWWGKMVIYPALRNFHPQDVNRWQIITDRIDCCRPEPHTIALTYYVWLKGERMYVLDQRRTVKLWNYYPLAESTCFLSCFWGLNMGEEWWRYSQNILTTWIKPTALCSDLAAPKERDGTDPVTEMEMISHPGKVPEVTGAPEKSAGWLIWEDRLSPNVMLYQHLCH